MEDLGNVVNGIDNPSAVSDDIFPVYAMIIIGLGALFALVTIFILVRKIHKRNQEAWGLTGFSRSAEDYNWFSVESVGDVSASDDDSEVTLVDFPVR
jgi:hypothetical protein